MIIDNKKKSMLKSVVNNCYFITKLTGVHDTKNKNNDKKEGNSSKNEDEKEEKEENKKSKKKKNKNKYKKKKKKGSSEESYISVSSDNKNIVSNNKFKNNFLNKSNDNINNKNIKKYNSKSHLKNSHTISTKKEKFKHAIPVLKFEKIKKDQQKYLINNNEIPALRNKNKKNKIKNSNNETLSSIDNISDNELESNENDYNNKYKYKNNNRIKKRNLSLNRYRKNKIQNDDIDDQDQDKSNQSTKIQVHKFNRNNSNIKIQIKSPLSPTIKYQQIDIKTGNPGYNKSFRIFPNNNFRKNINYIEAKNKDDKNINRENNLLKSIKIKTGLKPLKINSIRNSNEGKNTTNNPHYLQNSKTNDSKINIQINQNNENSNSNKELHHIVGYERHYGKEENCPVCKNMKKKSDYMEEIIFGQERKKFGIRPFIKKEDFNINNELKNKFKKKFMDLPQKEEEKNINYNNFLLQDVNPHNTVQSKSKSKQNLFRDTQRKYSSRRNQSVKNIYSKNESDQSLGNTKDYNLGNMFDIQFPAINSYFHS